MDYSQISYEEKELPKANFVWDDHKHISWNYIMT